MNSNSNGNGNSNSNSKHITGNSNNFNITINSRHTMIESTIPKNENTRVILRMAASIGASSLLAVSGCTTMVDPYGQPQNVLTPQGATMVRTLVTAGVGAGSGALLKNQPGWLNGMVSSLASGLTSQIVSNYRPRNYGYNYANNYSYQRQLPQMTIANQYIGGYNFNRNAYGTSSTSGIYKPNPIYRQQRLNKKYNQRYNQNYNQNVLYQRLPNGEFIPIPNPNGY